MTGDWTGSDRRSELPPDWPQRVQATRQRAGGRCEWVENGRRCPKPGAECDHAGHPLDHDHLQWLCKSHHRWKTKLEARAALREMRERLHYPVKPHPARGRQERP